MRFDLKKIKHRRLNYIIALEIGMNYWSRSPNLSF